MTTPAGLDDIPSAAATAHPWNGSYTPGGGAVQPPSNSDGSQNEAANIGNDIINDNKINDNHSHNYNNIGHSALGIGGETAGGEAMREGKQRARAVLEQAQGLGSRKRSRDGTPRAAPTSAADLAHHDAILLDRYMQRDMLHAAAMNDQAERSRHLIKAKEVEKEYYLHEVRAMRQQNPAAVFGPGYRGYGNGVTESGGKATLVYHTQRPPPPGRRARRPHIPRADVARQAAQHEELVPIRLDIELDKLRVRDTFTWNLHERLISPDVFADGLVEDLRLPPEAAGEVARQVRGEMHEQLQNFYPHLVVDDGPLEPGRPYHEQRDDELRVPIRLHITLGRVTLIDQFEWDINNPLNCPEDFARQMAWENALSGEFTTAIAHAIREQSQLYTKSLYLTNHAFDGRPVEDADLRDAFLPAPPPSIFRPPQTQKDWAPFLYEMSDAELDRTETSMMREHRAQKRQLNRRGGPALPDLKDRPRTVRSLIVHSVIPGAVESFETTGIPRTRRGGRGGRRSGRGGIGGGAGDMDVDSDELDSEDSAAEESSGPTPSAPATMLLPPARTRNMRGAASAAQAAMRAANYGGSGPGRSATPDSQLMASNVASAATPLETRGRRSAPLREDDEGDTLIVRLKIGRARLRTFWEEYRAKKRASEFPLSGYATQPPPSGGNPTKTASSSTTMHGSQNGGHHQRAGSTSSAPTETRYDERGRVDMTHWPYPNEAPPAPPPWLTQAISHLRSQHPDSSFTALMRPYAIDIATDKPTAPASATPGAPAPTSGDVRWQYLPRIKCNDCPGKVYTAMPGRVVEDFAVHLRNRVHRQKVLERTRSGAEVEGEG